MTFAKRLKGALIGLAICIVAAPIAFGITIALVPLWRWVEATFEVEAIGHSGPSDWCYLATYAVLLIIVAFLWDTSRRKARHNPGED